MGVWEYRSMGVWEYGTVPKCMLARKKKKEDQYGTIHHKCWSKEENGPFRVLGVLW